MIFRQHRSGLHVEPSLIYLLRVFFDQFVKSATIETNGTRLIGNCHGQSNGTRGETRITARNDPPRNCSSFIPTTDQGFPSPYREPRRPSGPPKINKFHRSIEPFAKRKPSYSACSKQLTLKTMQCAINFKANVHTRRHAIQNDI